MEEFEELLEEAKARNIEIMLDIVVNHSSTEHKWFKEAKKIKIVHIAITIFGVMKKQLAI